MNTNPQAIIVPPSAATASTNGVEVEDIRDIRGPVEIPNTWPAWLWLAGGLLLGFLAYLLYRRWRGPQTAGAKPTIVVPPHVRARQRLRQALEWIHEPEPFCTSVSGTLRVYLEEQFLLHAPERTTEEFLEELPNNPRFTQTQKQSLGDFLQRCDLVKFARHEPAETERRDLWDTAMRVVDETANDDQGPSNPQTKGTPPPSSPVMPS